MKSQVFIFTCVLALVLLMPGSLAAQDTATKGKSYYLDVHKLEPGSVSYADVANAHKADLETQGHHGVSFLTYWFDEEGGHVYCLSEADEAIDVKTTHKEAHGLVPDMIYQVVAGEQANFTGNGYLFLDIHDLEPGKVTATAVEEAHQHDLHVQSAHGVNFINYWVDESAGKVFCLSEAPSAEAVSATHKEAHGLVPTKVMMVMQGQ